VKFCFSPVTPPLLLVVKPKGILKEKAGDVKRI
jgi:hypothetical protein